MKPLEICLICQSPIVHCIGLYSCSENNQHYLFYDIMKVEYLFHDDFVAINDYTSNKCMIYENRLYKNLIKIIDSTIDLNKISILLPII